VDQEGEEKGFNLSFLDRLALNKTRIIDFCNGLREIAYQEDCTNKVLSERTIDNGIRIQEITVPFGVIGMIYEARPMLQSMQQA
jgi:glutamate-5-semialdehyde dehydrogenase